MQSILNKIGKFTILNPENYLQLDMGREDVIKIKKALKSMRIKSQMFILGKTALLIIDNDRYRVRKFEDRNLYRLKKNVALRNKKHPGKLFKLRVGDVLEFQTRGKFNTPGFLIHTRTIKSLFFPTFTFINEAYGESFDDVFNKVTVYQFRKSSYERKPGHSNTQRKRSGVKKKIRRG